ncbi:MAG: ROK family protein [Gaiellaceae bacterium]
MQAERVVGVDLGGTKILAGVVDRAGAIGATKEIGTPTDSQDAVLDALNDVIAEVLEDGILAVGLGAPLNFDRRTGRGFQANNLPLRDVDLGARIRDRFGLPVGIENDGNAAALAEWRLGAGRGTSNVVMLTLGTGVGGGIVIDDRLYRGWAELGHIVVVAGGPPCQGNCHGRGHLEAVASGHAAERVAKELWGESATAHQLVERARGGDAAAVAALSQIGELLGAAIGSLANVFDPDVVVIGGGFGAAGGNLLLDPARASASREAIEPADSNLRIAEAELGEEAGLIGAALVGFETFDGVR